MEHEIDDSIDTRKADNRIITTEKDIDKFDDQIEVEKNRIQELSEMQETVDEIVDNINKCIELLSKSMKGPTTENLFSDMYNSNKSFQTSVSTNIENNQIEIRKKLNELYKEKENIFEDNKEKSRAEVFKNNN